VSVTSFSILESVYALVSLTAALLFASEYSFAVLRVSLSCVANSSLTNANCELEEFA
jgi:hypothetical protein